MSDHKKDASDMLEAMQGYLRRCFEPVSARIKAVEDWVKTIPSVDQLRGADGVNGKDGLPGKNGEPGPAGADGQCGEKGADGKDGRDGVDGSTGKDGAPGKDGRDGIDGKDGQPGKDGAPGVGTPGKDGKDGEKGLDGREGRDGEPGRDAVHVDVLADIEPAKRYQRGTFAAYRGGMIRSFKATTPLSEEPDLEKAGWHVVLAGISEVAIETSDDMRTIGMAISLTNGTVVHKEMKNRVLLDRGVWKAEAYEGGDGVTWDGCFWIAQRSAQAEERPGDSSGAWRLAVKKGRDGRDGLRGPKGDQGMRGQA